MKEPAAMAPFGTPSPLPPRKVTINVAAPARTVKKRLMIKASIKKARPRLMIPAWLVGSGRRRRKKIRRTTRSKGLWSPRDFGDLPADVAEQADALRGLRLAHLGRVGDPLDQLLGLLRGEEATPDLVDQLAVEGLDQCLLDRGTVQRALHGLVDHRAFEHPGERPLHRLAFERGDDRLLGGDFDRFVDPGRAPDRPGATGPGPQQSRREWRALVGHGPSLAAT